MRIVIRDRKDRKALVEAIRNGKNGIYVAIDSSSINRRWKKRGSEFEKDGLLFQRFFDESEDYAELDVALRNL